MTKKMPPPARRVRFAYLLIPVLLLFCADTLLAHGTIQTPASRVYKCRFDDNPENPQDPACAAAVAFAGNPQFLYDWAGIRQGDAAGQHQQVVPDGELCSGGGAEFGGLARKFHKVPPRSSRWRPWPIFCSTGWR